MIGLSREYLCWQDADRSLLSSIEALKTMGQMAKRITVTLPDTIYRDLAAWADARGQAIAPLAAIAVELSVRAAKEDGEFTPPPDEANRDK